MQKYVDTVREIFFYYILILILGALGFSWAEKKPLIDSIWWVIVTASTTGYGDIAPVTFIGRAIATLIMHVVPLVITPLIAAHVASKLIVQNDAFTHQEQEDLKNMIKRINDILDQPKEKQ